MTVVVTEAASWWMGDVTCKEGGARDPKVIMLFQIVCVDKRVISWLDPDLVNYVLPST